MKSIARTEILACVVGILVSGFASYFIINGLPDNFGGHPIANPYSSEYHVHADFHIYVQDKLLDLSEDRFMTTSQLKHSEDVHLHDNDGDVEHVHAEGITFSAFLNSVGLNLTETCLTDVEGVDHCTDDSNVLVMLVNGEKVESISEYIPLDSDRILLYYGEPENPKLPDYMEAVPHDACYFSGTCPERGVAPPEGCGLTCEL